MMRRSIVRRRRSLGSTPTLLEENCLFVASNPSDPTHQEGGDEQQESRHGKPTTLLKTNDLMPMRVLCKMLQPPKIVGEELYSRQQRNQRRSSCQFWLERRHGQANAATIPISNHWVVTFRRHVSFISIINVHQVLNVCFCGRQMSRGEEWVCFLLLSGGGLGHVPTDNYI